MKHETYLFELDILLNDFYKILNYILKTIDLRYKVLMFTIYRLLVLGAQTVLENKF